MRKRFNKLEKLRLKIHDWMVKAGYVEFDFPCLYSISYETEIDCEIIVGLWYESGFKSRSIRFAFVWPPHDAPEFQVVYRAFYLTTWEQFLEVSKSTKFGHR